MLIVLFADFLIINLQKLLFVFSPYAMSVTGPYPTDNYFNSKHFTKNSNFSGVSHYNLLFFFFF